MRSHRNRLRALPFKRACATYHRPTRLVIFDLFYNQFEQTVDRDELFQAGKNALSAVDYVLSRFRQDKTSWPES
jgi:hypothetical protein